MQRQRAHQRLAERLPLVEYARVRHQRFLRDMSSGLVTTLTPIFDSPNSARTCATISNGVALSARTYTVCPLPQRFSTVAESSLLLIGFSPRYVWPALVTLT